MIEQSRRDKRKVDVSMTGFCLFLGVQDAKSESESES